MLTRICGAIGALLGLGVVAMAAYAAHGMAVASAADRQRMVGAIALQGLHALLLVTIALSPRPGLLLQMAAACVVLGVLLFCGSLYGAVFAGWSTAPAPFGGGLLMLGWLLLAVALLGRRR